MGYLVGYLAQRHYVVRVAYPTDSQAGLVRMTERGRRMAEVAYAALRQLDAEWTAQLAQLGEERMGQLRQTLRALVALVESHPPAARQEHV